MRIRNVENCDITTVELFIEFDDGMNVPVSVLMFFFADGVLEWRQSFFQSEEDVLLGEFTALGIGEMDGLTTYSKFGTHIGN